MDGHLGIIGFIFDKRNATINIYLITLSSADLSPVGKPKLLVSFPGSTDGAFSVARSENNKVVSFIAFPESDKDDHFVPFAFCINERFEVMWSKPLTKFEEDGMHAVQNQSVSDAGDVCFLATKEPSFFNILSHAPSYTNVELLTIRDMGTSVHSVPIALQAKVIIEMQCAFDKNGFIICTGFYSDDFVDFNYTGKCAMRVDANGNQIIQAVTQPFSDTDAFYFSKASATPYGADKGAFRMHKIWIQPDGGFILIAEKILIVIEYASNVNGNAIVNNIYYYQNIFVERVAPDFSIVWSRMIPKNQVTNEDKGYYSSYSVIEKQDVLYFFFNDNPENIGLLYGIKAEPMTPGNAVPVYVSISKSGELMKGMLDGPQATKTIFCPRIFGDMDNGNAFLYGEKGRTYQIGSISFPK